MTANIGEIADDLNDALAQLVDLFAKKFHTWVDIRTPSGMTFTYYRKQIFYGDAPIDRVSIDRAPLAVRVEFTKHVGELWDACQVSETSLAEQTVLARDRVLSFVKEHAT